MIRWFKRKGDDETGDEEAASQPLADGEASAEQGDDRASNATVLTAPPTPPASSNGSSSRDPTDPEEVEEAAEVEALDPEPAEASELDGLEPAELEDLEEDVQDAFELPNREDPGTEGPGAAGEPETEALTAEAELEEAELEDTADIEQAESILGFQEPSSRAVGGEQGPPQTADKETKRILRELDKQQKRRIEQVLAEAKEMERRAKELEEKAKKQEKLRKEYDRHAEYVEQLAPELGFDPDRPVTEVPPIDNPEITEVEFTAIERDRSYVRILFDEQTSQYLYEVIEPQLTEMEEEILEFLRDTLVRTMDGRRGPDQDWESYLTDAVERAILDHSILVDNVSKERLKYYVRRDFLGYGPIDVMMQDSMIEDISCDGPNIPLYIFHRQYESIKSSVVFTEEQALDSFVIKLAQRSGKHISIANPLLDATLPDTSRLQATLAREVTTRGSSFTIRKFRADPLTAPDLIRLGTMNSRMAAFFWMAMEEESPLLMAGGTASGKTTSLNAIAQFIPPTKKVVSIEDTREVNLIHENWIAGLTRAGFSGEDSDKGAGSIDMYKLLEAALRQRPEYLLVGEVRGPEAQTLFQAMATGHATYSTVHADSVMSAVYRLENEPIDVPRLMLQTLDGIAVQVQARVDNRMVRRIKDFTEIVGIDPRTGDLLTNQVYKWDPRTDEYRYLGKSHILERMMEKKNKTPEEIEREWENRTRVLDWMVDKGIRNIHDVSNVLSAYYARPEEVMDRIERSLEPEAVQEVGESPLTSLTEPSSGEVGTVGAE